MFKLKYILGMLIAIAVKTDAQKIYQVMYKHECDVKIMIVADVSESDLKVFFVDEEEKSVKPGCWFVCDFPDNADVKIYFTEDANEADIKIFLVEEESEAGWINESKKDKLKHISFFLDFQRIPGI